MARIPTLLGLAFLAAMFPTTVQAQYYIQPAPVYAPPLYRSYAVPRVSYYPAPVAYPTYAAPQVSYYPAPVVQTTYAAPVYSTYAAPVVAPAPGVYTTYTYRNGLGIFRPRFVNQSYYTPVYP